MNTSRKPHCSSWGTPVRRTSAAWTFSFLNRETSFERSSSFPDPEKCTSSRLTHSTRIQLTREVLSFRKAVRDLENLTALSFVDVIVDEGVEEPMPGHATEALLSHKASGGVE